MTRNNDRRCESGNQVSGVSQATLAAHITIYKSRSETRWTSIAKHYQIIDLKESHCIINVASSTRQCIPFSNMKKIFGADIKNIGVWSIVLYQDFLKVIPKSNLGSHSHGNMKQSAIFGVTDHTLNAASVAPHQLKNGMALIMTWWLSGLSFSVDTVLSVQHHQVCNWY